MTQETRKDARAKIVSLNVRYKSATVDEFIENHSYDVSKGGVFIKTATPFAPGTLLKFEIRIAGDVAVIGGVGRVVWKREAATATGEIPAGMGVKFIKLDDSSRATIDKLVQTKGDVKSAFDAGPAGDGAALPAAAAADAPAPSVSIPSTASAPTPAAPAPAAPTPPPVPVAAAASPAAETPAPAANFFPTTNSRADMPPPNERTVMKQAAELLEEALIGAGGSMDEVGHNPLFDEPKRIVPSTSLGDRVAPSADKPVDVSPPTPAPEPSPAPAPAAAAAPISEPPPAPVIAPAKAAALAPISTAPTPATAPAKKNGWILPAVIVGMAVVGFIGYSVIGSEEAPPPVPSAAPPPPPPPVVSAAPPPPAMSAAPVPSAAPSAGDIDEMPTAPSAAPSGSGAPKMAPSAAPSAALPTQPAKLPAAVAAPVAPPPPPKPAPVTPPTPAPAPPPAETPTAATPPAPPPAAPAPAPKPAAAPAAPAPTPAPVMQ